jgi:hypothetical protein
MVNRNYKEEFIDFLKQYKIYDNFINALTINNNDSQYRSIDEIVIKEPNCYWISTAFCWVTHSNVNWMIYHNLWLQYLNPDKIMYIKLPYNGN